MSPIATAEQFQDVKITTGGAVNDPLTPGVRESIPVPRDATKRFIWLAAGAYFQERSNDYWWVVGRLNFFLDGSKVGQFLFTDSSSELTDLIHDAAPRRLLRIRADASGSLQPALRYQRNTGGDRNNLDLPAFLFETRMDSLQYELEASYSNFGGASYLGFLTGLRVLSY